MKREAPAARARVRELSSPRVVTTMMGKLRSASCARTNSTTSKPPISGMLRSRNTRSNGDNDSRSMASRPLAACVNWASGSPRRHATIISRMTLLSSTTRISTSPPAAATASKVEERLSPNKRTCPAHHGVVDRDNFYLYAWRMSVADARRIVWVVDDSPLDAERARSLLAREHEVRVFGDGSA